jgi:hypothetical protein
MNSSAAKCFPRAATSAATEACNKVAANKKLPHHRSVNRSVPHFVSKIAFAIVAVFFAATATTALAQKDDASAPVALGAAKTAYFEDRTGAPEVGKAALAELKLWGHYKLVDKRTDADIMILLSRQPVAAAVARNADETTKRYAQQGQPKSVYLTVIDLDHQEILWGDRHVWGGLLTGQNSAGVKLIKELEKKVGN